MGDPELAQPLRVLGRHCCSRRWPRPRWRAGAATRAPGGQPAAEGVAWRRRGAVGERVPDGGALAVLLPAALRLVGGAAHGPEEAVGEGVVE